ncbi:F0F1 ATP synthase subunit gamma [Nostocoides sp.]|uniref:F0F1 ATP synthase subunit gamma n=1 Tax=Nostocoides sp. TaxID=1917966 RepID=UPI003BAEC9DC
MGAQIRVYRQRIRSVTATKKITRAMELMAASRVIKARSAVLESAPYTHALTGALSSLASFSNHPHPMTTEVENPKRAGVLILTSDRGLAGAYASGAIKESERLLGELRGQGKEVQAYLVGRKAVSYYKFRGRDYAAEWTGNTEKPQVERAREISERLVADFLQPTQEGGLDEIHIVYTRFNSMVNQEPRVLRLLPIEIVDPPAFEVDHTPDILPLYEFEPSAEEVLKAMLPRYVTARIWTCMLGAAASELAARQRAMKSATDNAENLISTYTRLANQARQAEITQEISEIVGGASALAESK